MTERPILRLATRKSRLALTQSEWVAERLRAARPDVDVQLVQVVTSGDRIQDRVLREVGGKSLFVKEIEEALLNGEADLAVHSLKDLPTELPEGLMFFASPPREDPRDALVANPPVSNLDELEEGARIGTSSLRRASLLRHLRPDLQIVTLRGNVPTRLKKLEEGLEYRAIVLAEAGLRRLGFGDVPRLPFDVLQFPPAAGQGALAIEAPEDRPDLQWIRALLDHAPTRLAVEAERAFLARLEGGCNVPVGAHGRWRGSAFELIGCVAHESGDVVRCVRVHHEIRSTSAAAAFGRELAERVLLAGGAGILALYAQDISTHAPTLTSVPRAPAPGTVARPEPGTVYLVGAGPGDHGLITMRGHGLLQIADAVVFDYLANNDLLTPIRADAERHFVGKRAGEHSLSQDEINDLLIDLAQRHRVVVRLKGGDPFIFGRGGEEAEALAAAGVPFEIVPGVTSAIAAPAFAGVPLTHRDYSGSVAFVTGHGQGEFSDINWPAVAGMDTIVILMGTRRVRQNAQALLAAGRDPADPALVVEWASFPRQRTLLTKLVDLPRTLERSGFTAPAVIVLGRVAALHPHLDWFARRPLFGRRVLVTRSRSQSSRLSTLLFQLGAVPVELPALEIHPVDGAEQRRLDEALLSLETYDWVVFTSHNGVVHTFSRLRDLQLDARALAGTQVAVIGAATADVLRQHGVVADLVPDRFDAEGLLAALEPLTGPSASVLVLRAKEGRETLIDGLRERAIFVDDVAAYTSQPPQDLGARLDELLDHPPDLVTFASTKTVTYLVEAAGSRAANLCAIPAACIGPVTRRAAEAAGFDVVVQPERYTLDDLVRAVADWVALDLNRSQP